MAITYTYKCTNPHCSHYEALYEVKQSISEPRHTFCNECSQSSLQRVLVPSESGGFRLKGKGWTGKLGNN